ncbi:hypothetical protein V9T40_013210 [Parthenolecanium corni]|uniref:Uncharacterized protein n=1 Tax=Parthenolecanium corni TaxID=536013 RepID=A0AAN9TNC2_9HEMI
MTGSSYSGSCLPPRCCQRLTRRRIKQTIRRMGSLKCYKRSTRSTISTVAGDKRRNRARVRGNDVFGEKVERFQEHWVKVDDDRGQSDDDGRLAVRGSLLTIFSLPVSPICHRPAAFVWLHLRTSRSTEWLATAALPPTPPRFTYDYI